MTIEAGQRSLNIEIVPVASASRNANGLSLSLSEQIARHACVAGGTPSQFKRFLCRSRVEHRANDIAVD
jgi:hypothetical protein